MNIIYRMIVCVPHLTRTKESSSSGRDGRVVSNKKVCGRAQISRDTRPTFSVVQIFKSICPIGT
jgi:hypothetical protein